MTNPGLAALLASHEDWLIDRIIEYAKLQGYTRYTSTLREAWRASIAGLTAAISAAYSVNSCPPELTPDENFANDPIAAFGIEEARKHRARGVTLSMFLGLMKYYRASYQDLCSKAALSRSNTRHYRRFIDRSFDRIEIGFCTEWSALPDSAFADELVSMSRWMANEKNKYLTIFESISVPVILFNKELAIENMNHTAAMLFCGRSVPGVAYYGNFIIRGVFDTLSNQIQILIRGDQRIRELESHLETTNGSRLFHIKLQRMLDVSDKFHGTVAILADITKNRQLEVELRSQSFHDDLTELFNRRGFLSLANQQLKIAKRSAAFYSLFFIDLDEMKRINDTFGHCQGDQALIDLAGLLRATFRESDLLARFGGDEFVVLAECVDQQSEMMAARLQTQIDLFNAQGGRPYRLAASIGLIPVDPTTTASIDEKISQADSAMYRKKRQTRETPILERYR